MTGGGHRVLQITAWNFPPEIRVLKEAYTLRDAGFASAVLCPPMPGRPARESWHGIEIFRPESLAAAFSPLDKVLYQATYYSPAWRRAIAEVIREFRPAVLHVHDIWLARSVFAARGREKVVMDLHENMPAAVTEYLKAYRGAQKLFNFVFKPRFRVLHYERTVLKRSDRTLVVVAEAASRVRGEHPELGADQVFVVENLESKDFLSSVAEVNQTNGAQPSVLYIGGFGPHRGIDTLIEAMKHLKEWGVQVRLDLIGATRGSAYVDMLRALVARLDVGSHVNMVDWVPAELVPSYIRNASVGAVPHHANPHTDNTIPHKLYQYMIAGTPVLVSTSPPLARTVTAARAGAIFRASDAVHCAETIRDMLRDPARLQQYGASGRDYVLRAGHNWDDESAPRLIAMYRSLLDQTA
jgi:glycosyltransferase involved in cell wall biosynthesis